LVGGPGGCAPKRSKLEAGDAGICERSAGDQSLYLPRSRTTSFQPASYNYNDSYIHENEKALHSHYTPLQKSRQNQEHKLAIFKGWIFSTVACCRNLLHPCSPLPYIPHKGREKSKAICSIPITRMLLLLHKTKAVKNIDFEDVATSTYKTGYSKHAEIM
jgi:hypothetical protein